MRKIDKKKIIMDNLVEIVYIIVGAFCISIGINLFLLPNKMTTGGVSGVATILYYKYNISMGMTILTMNLPLFITSFIKLGKKFTYKTVLATFLLSLFLEIFKFNEFVKMLNLDLLLSCIIGGIIVGVGTSLIFKAGASSGGSDLLANIIYKIKKFESISQILLVIEVVIISCIIFVFKDVNIGVYSIIAIIISTKVIDVVFDGIYYTKVTTIITDKKDEIIYRILNELKRGATFIDARGAHTGNHKYMVTCVISKNQVSKIKQIVKEEDKEAIMYFTLASEALGYGFKSLI